MTHRMFRRLALTASALVLTGSIAGVARADFRFNQINLVSDTPGLAAHTDPNLINPWGISSSPASPFWVSNQGSGTSTLYNSAGVPQSLVVTVPQVGASPPHGPTGQVFNNTTDFALSAGGKALFLFASLDGSISGWNASKGTTAEIKVTPTSPTTYTGLAIGNNGVGNFLYAADDRNGKIDVFNGTFGAASLAGKFTDPNLPTGFNPHNIQNLGGTLFVAYENSTTGGGVVDAFDLSGNFLRRISANGANGPLQTPWGLAIAPASFGSLGGALLVGNEDLGTINGFNPTTGAFLGTVLGLDGNPLVNVGLWGLKFGNGGNGGSPDTLYFAAGLTGEVHGLLGAIVPVPEPSSIALILAGAGVVLAGTRVRRRGR